ncbi:MAG: hypothetical protein HWE16_13950 [Gammaproteobacteria bacterium]|nr:hypothetical protein [Gammaproteobacteria bacterium]
MHSWLPDWFKPLIVILLLLPLILLVFSKRAKPKEKLLWALAIVWASWLGWILYVLLAPLAKPEQVTED